MTHYRISLLNAVLHNLQNKLSAELPSTFSLKVDGMGSCSHNLVFFLLVEVTRALELFSISFLLWRGSLVTS